MKKCFPLPQSLVFLEIDPKLLMPATSSAHSSAHNPADAQRSPKVQTAPPPNSASPAQLQGRSQTKAPQNASVKTYRHPNPSQFQKTQTLPWSAFHPRAGEDRPCEHPPSHASDQAQLFGRRIWGSGFGVWFSGVVFRA